MATPFTTAHKAKIRRYLGWSARFHQGDSRLEQAMSAIEQEASDDTRDAIIADLAAADDLQTRITGAYNRLKAMKVGSIDLPGGNEIAILRQEGARYCNTIAATLGVPVLHNVFSPGKANAFASWDGNQGGGNTIRQG